jgi:hypothetical protein
LCVLDSGVCRSIHRNSVVPQSSPCLFDRFFAHISFNFTEISRGSKKEGKASFDGREAPAWCMRRCAARAATAVRRPHTTATRATNSAPQRRAVPLLKNSPLGRNMSSSSSSASSAAPASLASLQEAKATPPPLPTASKERKTTAPKYALLFAPACPFAALF